MGRPRRIINMLMFRYADDYSACNEFASDPRLNGLGGLARKTPPIWFSPFRLTPCGKKWKAFPGWLRLKGRNRQITGHTGLAQKSCVNCHPFFASGGMKADSCNDTEK